MTLQNSVVPHVCWGQMDDHTVCIRLDGAQEGKNYRVIFDCARRITPEVDGLFRFSEAVPGQRYSIAAEEETSPSVWEPCVQPVTLNFIPSPPEPPGPVQHTCGGMPVRPSENMNRAILTKVIQHDDQ